MSQGASLIVEAELSSKRFAEIGRPAGAYRRDDGRFVALASTFDSLYWPARATYDGHRLRHRISLYSEDLGTRLAVFDGSRFPVNDVAFHPSRSVLAVATGEYDGGRSFEGELLLWNWETGETTEVLSERREVSRVRFADATTLAVLLRPRDDQELGEESFATFFGGTLGDLRGFAERGLRAGEADPRIAEFARVDPAALGLAPGHFEPADHERRWRERLEGSGFEPRHRVWDVAWFGSDRVLAVHDRCQLEAWTLRGRRESQFEDAGHGVQLLESAHVTLVHVIERSKAGPNGADTSILFAFDGKKLDRILNLDRAVSFSIDRQGRFLCRDTGSLAGTRSRKDRVLDASGKRLFSGDLGHYDCFNHYLRIDGADHLYFLRGTPLSSHQHKVLCRIDTSGSIEERFPWDPAEPHLMSGTACLLPDGTLIRAYRRYDPRPGRFAGNIEALDSSNGRSSWSRSIPALATCLTPLHGRPWLVYALTDGRVGILHTKTGDPLLETSLRVDGVDTVVQSLRALGHRLACGTIDGRVLVLRVA